MNKSFTDGNFLLETATAVELFHNHASGLPIIDYHCHLSPKMIADDHRFGSITELWLSGDHYKWRAMRANGIAENFITGTASDWEKFSKWAETVPYTLRNPLYHWTHMELRTAFGIDETLNPESAKRIYDECNSQLQHDDMTVRGLMRKYNVETVCTTDDPVDDLSYHKIIRESGFEIKVLPTWRPDKAMSVENGADYQAYIKLLSDVSGVQISTYDDLIAALQRRHDFFHDNGCRLSDHGLCRFPFKKATKSEICSAFDRALSGHMLSADEIELLKTDILAKLCRMNYEKDWVQQFHFGPMRNVNKRMFQALGPDAGFDTIGDYRSAEAISAFFDMMDCDGALAKSILYNLNPSDNVWVAAMIANFQDGSCPGKIQMGSGWWFNDQIEGIKAQMNALSLQGLLSRFVGMLTDSRSFVSYPRHEYFRRILCNMIGKDVDRGLIPISEMNRVKSMVEDICYYNAVRYFKF